MGLAVGVRFGWYEVVGLIGAGGMGEVYRAHDTKLNRDVALKVLPDAFAVDADRVARFKREAQVLASLNHPGIAAIYGFEDGTTTLALVMELVDGPTLADRIAHGPVPVHESLSIARQIADALKAAHHRGIVHRDLKPANLKVRADGRVKVLDFGLAKVLQQEPRTDAVVLTSMATVTAHGKTQVGTVLGTAAYMSPEQARGEHVDQRTDIWAFGCVLFEMLAGHSPFARTTASGTLAAVLEGEPDWDALAPGTSPKIRALLRRCLEKDPNQRLAALADADGDLIADESAESHSRRRYPLNAAVFAGVAAVVAAVWFAMMRVPKPVTSPSEYIQLTNVTDAAMTPSLSPDGRLITFKRGVDPFLGAGQIYVKVLPDGDSVRLTDDPRSKYNPVFTPDGSRVAYTQLTPEGPSVSWDTWTVPVIGGPSTRLLPNASGLTWLPDRRVLFSEVTVGLHMQIVSATESRADSRLVYSPSLETGMAHYSSQSPDLRSVLIVEMGNTHTFDSPCRLVPFDGSSPGRPVGPSGMCYAAAWSPDGRWMYFAANVGGRSHLWRQAAPNGTPQQITFGANEEEGVAVALDGRSLITSVGRRVSALWLHDRDGERPITSEGYASDPRWSGDGTRVYYRDSGTATTSNAAGPAPPGELRSLDLKTGSVETMLPGVSVTGFDISSDDRDVVFTTMEQGTSQLWIQPLNRSASARLLARSADQPSFAGQDAIVFREMSSKENFLARIKVDGSGLGRVIPSPIMEKHRGSPDGEWVAAVVPLTKNDARLSDALAVPYDTMAVSIRGGSFQKLCNGACSVTWSNDGRFLYVFAGNTIVLPIAAGRSLPDLPAAGIAVGNVARDLPGRTVIPAMPVVSRSDPSTYLFTRVEHRANLFRIPLH